MGKIKFDWSLVESRSELGRQLMLERLVKQNKKQQLVAYSLWALLAGFGVHRMYLRQWRQAFILIGFYFFVFAASIMLHFNGGATQLYSSLTTILLAIAIGIWVYEGFRLYFLVGKWNAELREEIEMSMAFV